MSAIEAMAVVMNPAGRNCFEHRLVADHTDRTGSEEGHDHRRQDRQPKLGVGDIAREGADGRMRGEREIRKAQHGVDRGQAYGGHRQDGAGHRAVDDELRYLREQRRHRAIRRPSPIRTLPPLTLL